MQNNITYQEWKEKNKQNGILSLQYFYKDKVKKGYCYDVDLSRSHGILHITNELTVYFKMQRKRLIFSGADELGCGGWWSYSHNERRRFEEDHKGLLEYIQDKMNNGKFSVWD